MTAGDGSLIQIHPPIHNQKNQKKPDSNADVFFAVFILRLFYRVDVYIPPRKLKMALIVAVSNKYKSVILYCKAEGKRNSLISLELLY